MNEPQENLNKLSTPSNHSVGAEIDNLSNHPDEKDWYEPPLSDFEEKKQSKDDLLLEKQFSDSSTAKNFDRMSL